MTAKRWCTGALVLGLMTATGMAQGVVWEDDFDSYDLGSALDGQGGWEPWTGSTLTVTVTDDQALSAPHSIGVSSADDLVRQYSGFTTGVFAYTAYQYIPADAAGGATSFLLLNNYPAAANPDWSSWFAMDVDAGVVRSEFEANELPLIQGEWVELRVVINLDLDTQELFYGGELISAKSWTGGIADGGLANIGAVDLFGDTSSFLTYYDDMTLEELEPNGACCLEDGTCFIADDQSACDGTPGGVFRGVGSSCEASSCPELTEDGWLVEAPDTWTAATGHADTCDETSDCGISASPDLQWVVSVPRDREWVFSACDASFDSILSLGSTPCTFDIAQEDDSAGCGVASEIREFLTADGGPYYLTLEGFSSGACGPFTLDFREICPLLADNPKALDEGEPCGDDLNGGCNSDVPAYTSIECGDVYRGTGFQDGGTRDTDWYELVLTETTTITIEGDSETAGYVMGLIQYTEGLEGSGNCDDISGFIVPADQTNPCFEESASAVAADLPADLGGIYWVFAAPSFAFDIIDCGDHDVYELRLTCGEGEPCTSDIDMSGVVGFSDLVTILSNWGPCPGCPADLDGSGVVGFSDLVQVLADWGPCP